MSNTEVQQSIWIYEGIWGVLSRFFCVPRLAPQLPAMDSELVVSRKPSPGFVRYLKFQFWIVTAIIVVALCIGSVVAVVAADHPLMIVVMLLVALLVATICMVFYLGIYLRFDTTWYVFSDRSMRLRRGIWTIHESTITFENVQNVKVTQGPVQRFFGIANVVVETAGGGGAQPQPGQGLGMHAGLIEGVAEASEIRDSIMSHVRKNATTGLGDEVVDTLVQQRQWSPKHLDVLREIRDLARAAT